MSPKLRPAITHNLTVRASYLDGTDVRSACIFFCSAEHLLSSQDKLLIYKKKLRVA